MPPGVPPAPRSILICPQEFKGSLTAHEAARALARGVRRALPDAEVVEFPMADGGPGTVAIVAAAGAEPRTVEVTGPLGAPLEAIYAFDPASNVATIEATAAAGLLLIPPEARNPLRASTRGVGELIAQAVDDGAREVARETPEDLFRLGAGLARHVEGDRLQLRLVHRVARCQRLVDADQQGALVVTGVPEPPARQHLFAIVRQPFVHQGFQHLGEFRNPRIVAPHTA